MKANFIDEMFEVLLLVPWWVGPLLAAVAYIGLGYAVPAIFADRSPPDPVALVIIPFAKVGAPFLAIVIFVAWVLAEVRKRSRRRLFDDQTGLATIRNLSWQEFEHLVGEAYRRQGYLVEETGRAGCDGGVDILLNRAGELVIVQCKHWQAWTVGVKPVRELFGVMHGMSATRAILVTSGRFTSKARRFAEGKAIDLLDGSELWELVRSVKTTTAAPGAHVGHVRMNAKSSEAAASCVKSNGTNPNCPKCGAAMLLREAKKGPNAGSKFWGCSRFPKCRGTKDLI